MIKKIITNLKELQKPCQKVEKDEDISTILEDLKDTLNTVKGYGLSANQIDYNKAIAIILYLGKEIVLINPKIVEKSEKIIFKNEACLSLPGLFINTDRYKEITIENGKLGEECKYSFSGLEAVIIQHEIDHLNGRTILDRKHKKR